MATIEFFFDIASPYTYLAATQMAAVSERTGADVRWRPFLLGGVFKATGNAPPAMVPARGRYLMKDLYRWAAMYDVAFSFPANFPVNSIVAMRALQSIPESERPAPALSLFRAYWADNANPTDPAVIAEHLGAEALQAATSQPVKDALRAASDEAVERGAFGAPTFFVGEQMWFGNDRLPLVESFLAG